MQAAINASNAATTGAKVEQVYIPTPDASKRWNEYDKYYSKSFTEPASYIRLSATVEDTAGCPYCMDEEDEQFLKEMNSKIKDGPPCTEDEFEMICHKFETTIAEKQPYLTMDPTQVLAFEDLSPVIIQEITQAENDPASPEFLLATTTSSIYRSTLKKSNTTKKDPITSFKQFGEIIYPHWKNRKIQRGGRSVFPTLKFEEGGGTEKEDNDPYVCFRRRELRQVRKTRRTDQQSSQRLRKLQAEMETAKKLMEMVVKREQMRKEALQMEWDIFEQRCKVKGVKRRLGIKGEDEDLVAHKKKKTEEPAKKAIAAAAETTPTTTKSTPSNEKAGASVSSATGTAATVSSSGASGIHSVPANVRLPASKIPDIELLNLEQVLSEKETTIKNAVKAKLKSRAQNDNEWVNYTDNPFVPYCDYFDPDLEQRKNLRIIDPKHASYSSLASPYPPSNDVPLRLPLSSSLGSSYASRVETSPTVLRAEIDEEKGDLSITSTVQEKDMAAPNNSTGAHFNIPRRSAVSLRRRVGRGGRIMVDRRGLVTRPQPNYDDDDDVMMQQDDKIWKRYEFDSDMQTDNMEFSTNDPSRLNGISDETQSIRFGSMLLSKAYESYREAYQQRQQQLLTLQQKVLQQQKEQKQQQQQNNNNNNNNGGGGGTSGNKGASPTTTSGNNTAAAGRVSSTVRPTSMPQTPARAATMMNGTAANANGTNNVGTPNGNGTGAPANIKNAAATTPRSPNVKPPPPTPQQQNQNNQRYLNTPSTKVEG